MNARNVRSPDNLTSNVERRTSNVERRTSNVERRTPNAERVFKGEPPHASLRITRR
jgi:hypothetical protein